jgi:hypothetical protein
LPVSLSAVSSRGTGLPAIVQSFGSLSLTSRRGGTLAAASATLPKVVVRPEPACVITPLAAVHSPDGTPQRVGDQHLARHRAATADIALGLADAAAAAGREIAPHAVAREVLARRRVLGGDLGPVALELFGHELGKSCERALPHLRAGNTNHDRLVRLDHHPGIDLWDCLGR